MSQRQHPIRKSRQVEWKCVAINEKTPRAHAKKLEEALNELTEGGYALTNMQPRGNAIILTASRMIEQSAPETAPLPDRTAN